MMEWAMARYISVWPWEPDDEWTPSPPSFKLYFRVHKFPNCCWHGHYFHLLVAGIGTPLYVDRANIRGIDRATLRVAVRTADPALLPPSIVVNIDDKWKVCPISLIGWELSGNPPDGYDGPTRGGQAEDVNWEAEFPSYRPGADSELRNGLMAVRQSLRREMLENLYFR